MPKYEVKFFDKESEEEVFYLEIDGGSRTKLLYNIITENWEQNGYFTLDEYDSEDVFYNFLQFFCDNVPYPSEDPDEYKKFMYNLEMLCEYGLNIRTVISKYNLEISEEEILDNFCASIIELFDHEAAGTTEFEFTVYKIN